MKFKLEMITIETEPRVGYWIYVDNTLYRIKRIDGNLAGLVNYLHTTNKIDANVHIDNIRKCVVKFLAITKDRTFSIINGDFNLIVRHLCGNDRLGFKFGTLTEGGEVIMDGKIENYKSKLEFGDYINIVDINIIDSYGIYDKTKRRCKIIKRINDGIYQCRFTIGINSDIILTRDQMISINKSDTNTLMRIICPNCKK